MIRQVQLRFILTQHNRDNLVMNNIKQYFGCGTIKETEKLVRFVVINLGYINKIIISFFYKYYLQGSKRLDYKDFLKVFDLMENKDHLTQEGIEEILLIKAGINRGRKKSKISGGRDSDSDIELSSEDTTPHTTFKTISVERPLANKQDIKSKVAKTKTIAILSSPSQIKKLFWLVGFTDGDGCLSMYKEKIFK
jgi:LAGLIDADG endonuclease